MNITDCSCCWAISTLSKWSNLMIHAFHMKRVMWGGTPMPLDAVVVFQSDLLLPIRHVRVCQVSVHLPPVVSAARSTWNESANTWWSPHKQRRGASEKATQSEKWRVCQILPNVDKVGFSVTVVLVCLRGFLNAWHWCFILYYVRQTLLPPQGSHCCCMNRLRSGSGLLSIRVTCHHILHCLCSLQNAQL